MSKSKLIHRLDQEIIIINRSPVLTLWCSIVGREEGYSKAFSLKAGRVIASMLARTKGRRLGVIHELPTTDKRKRVATSHDTIFEIAGFRLPLEQVREAPTAPQIQLYLEKSFGKSLPIVSLKMKKLCRAFPNIGVKAYRLYEQFRPQVSEGIEGWAQKGVMDLKIFDRIVAGQRFSDRFR